MKVFTTLRDNSNILGSLSSSLCLAHCLATPFLFAAHASHVHGHHSSPFWWGTLDSLFIAISFIAVRWSVKNTSKKWMKYALWVSWSLLAFVIVNEKMSIISLPESVIYIPSVALVGLHIYNRKYCSCVNDKDSCCA